MTDPSSFAGKYAVITGSTQGLGEATAQLFADRGAAGIVVVGRNQQRGDAVAAALEAKGTKAVFVSADMADLDACRAVIAKADAAFGSLHALVNCAATTDRGSIWDTTPELFDRTVAINMRAPFFLMQDAIKLMQRDGIAGSIVNISSVAAHGCMPFLCPYSMSKGGLDILTKNVAYAAAWARIRVNSLLLGQMDTPGEDDIQRRYHGAGENWLAEREAETPFGRILKPDEVARAIAYLASDESGMMTGATIDFDQSVPGGGPPSMAPPMDQWEPVAGVPFK